MSVFYPYDESKHFDWDYYCGTHIPLVEEKLGDALLSVTVDRGLGGPGPGMAATYTAVAHLCFESLEDFETYCVPLAAEFDDDVPNFTDITPVRQISEVVV